MDIPFNADLPPVPGCFSKLLSSESESTESSAASKESELPNQPWREAEKLRELKEIMLKSLAQRSVSEDCDEVQEHASETTLVNFNDGSSELKLHAHDGCDGESERILLSSTDYQSNHHLQTFTSPFCRLNTALCRLKMEMVNLRHLDMSLFCQLLSLNEAIQDFKMSVNDRCSDYTGSEYTYSEYTSSEYSFGEGMGSRVGSFSSLNDETDWGRDYRLPIDDPGSPLGGVGGGGEEGGEERASAEELAASTSSFLQQIKDLTLRVESDF